MSQPMYLEGWGAVLLSMQGGNLRRITSFERGCDGNVTIVNGEGHWGPRTVEQVIGDIRSGRYRYTVDVGDISGDLFPVSGGTNEELWIRADAGPIRL